MTVLERSTSKTKFTVLPTDGNANTANILIAEGKFDGVVFSYGEISVNDDKDTSDGILTFDYFVQEPIDLLKTINEQDLKDLQQIIGDVLVEIIEDYVLRNNNDNRNDNSK